MAAAQGWSRIVPVAACLAVLFLCALRWYTPSHQQFSAPLAHRQDITPYNLTITARANDRNDAIPGWSSPLSTYLATPFEQLDEKGKAIVIGKRMICILDEDSESTHSPQSGYTDTADLGRARYGWGYTRIPLADHDDGILSEFALHDAFVDLSISEDKSNWYQVSVMHGFKSTSGGVNYPPTYGTYQSLFNIRDGVIVATQNYGPVYENERDDV